MASTKINATKSTRATSSGRINATKSARPKPEISKPNANKGGIRKERY